MSIQLELVRVNRALGKPDGTPWPENFTPKQAAYFAAWQVDKPDPHWSARAGQMTLACQRGELTCTTITERVPDPNWPVRPRIIAKGYSPYGQPIQRDRPPPRPTVEVTRYSIAAAPLAAWLEAQHVQPGELLLAWFEAQGVGVAVEPPAPAKKEPVPDRNARWLRVWDDESLRHAPGSQSAAIAKIVSAEGVEPATVKKALQVAEKAREEARSGGNVSPMPKNKKAPASPFPTTVHRMK